MRAEQQEKSTKKKAKNSAMVPASIVQMPVEKVAWLPLPSLLTWFLTMTKRAKSMAMTISPTRKVKEVMRAAKSAPHMPDPSATRKARKERPQTIGCKTMTRVSALLVFLEALWKLVSSMIDTTAVGS